MIVPSKFTDFDNSILGKLHILLSPKHNWIGVRDLYLENIDDFSDAGEFVLALDVLYLLDKIEVNFEKGLVHYVG